MNTRFTAINLTLAGLTAGALVSFAGNTHAAPATDTRPPEAPPTAETTPTTMGPTTLPPILQDEAVTEVTVDLSDHAPEREPVATLSQEATDLVDLVELEPIDHDVEPRYEPIEEAESPTKIELDPELIPDPEHLAPCGVVPYNLAPIGPVRLVDMTGDGSPNDRLSIRQVGSGNSTGYRLHLELAEGTRSEVHIPAFSGYLPAIAPTVQLGLESAETHPAPAAEEVLVTTGEIGTTRFWQLFGTDERGCVASYTNEIGSPAGLMFRHDDWFRSGWSCGLSGQLMVEQATRQIDDTWDVERSFVRRTGPTTVERSQQFASYGLTTPPSFGASC